MSDLPPEIDTGRPHPAGSHDALIGGENNFAADRETVARVLLKSPNARIAPRENRAFLGRAVRFLTAEAGLRQFLDIGTGLPTASNVHEVAQAIEPVVPGRLRGQRPAGPAPRASLADFRPPGPHRLHPGRRPRSRGHPDRARTPASCSTWASRSRSCCSGCCTCWPTPTSRPRSWRRCMGALPSGSYLVASHLTTEHDRERTAAGQAVMRDAGMTMQKRDSDVFAAMAFTASNSSRPAWSWSRSGARPTPPARRRPRCNIYGGVARKP